MQQQAAGSGAGGDQFGVDLQSLIVNGVGNVTGQVANTTNTAAEPAGEATSQAIGANRSACKRTTCR